jgi:hypothetical protein
VVKPPAAFAPPVNRLLARLPEKDYQRLLHSLKPIRLDLKDVLYEPRSAIDHVYFPHRGVVSAVTLMGNSKWKSLRQSPTRGISSRFLPAPEPDAVQPRFGKASAGTDHLFFHCFAVVP